MGDDADRDVPVCVLLEGPVNVGLLSNSEVHAVALAITEGTLEPVGKPRTAPPGTAPPTALPTRIGTYVPTFDSTVEITAAPTQEGLMMYFWGVL